MDLTIVLCMCIGSAVAWLVALYTERGAYLLLWNTFFGMAGAALCAISIELIAPKVGLVGLVIGGPPVALLAIVVGQKIRRALA